jgi:hypothetical protein
VGSAGAEKRFYLLWRRGDLSRADEQLLDRAGIDPKGKIVLHFLPAEIETMVAEVEKSHAGDKADRIDRTRFGIRPRADGYEFYVMEQTYR